VGSCNCQQAGCFTAMQISEIIVCFFLLGFRADRDLDMVIGLSHSSSLDVGEDQDWCKQVIIFWKTPVLERKVFQNFFSKRCISVKNLF
jgi:hypothetical protein